MDTRDLERRAVENARYLASGKGYARDGRVICRATRPHLPKQNVTGWRFTFTIDAKPVTRAQVAAFTDNHEIALT